MTFLRNCALLLPAAYLLAALSFLLVHGRQDAVLAVYPFLGDWVGWSRLPDSPQSRFLLQTTLLFLVPYLLWNSLLVLVISAEWGLWGRRERRPAGMFRRLFSAIYVALFLLLSAAIGASTEALRRRLPADVHAGPAAVAAAPFVAAAAAFLPALLAALPVAGFLKMRR